MKIPTAVIVKKNKSESDTFHIDEDRLVDVEKEILREIDRKKSASDILDELTNDIIQVRDCGDGNLDKKSFYLDDEYDWIIVKDSDDQICLVPLKKLEH